MEDKILREVRCLTLEFSNFLDLALSSKSFRNSGSDKNEKGPPMSLVYDREKFKKFPRLDENLYNYRTGVHSDIVRDMVSMNKMKDTADIAEQLASECDCETINQLWKILRAYRQSVNDLIHQYQYFSQKNQQGSQSFRDSGLRSTTELLKNFYEAFTCITGIVTAFLDDESRTNSVYLKWQVTKLSQSTNKMILYIESNMMYNLLMRKLNRIEEKFNEIKLVPPFALTDLLIVMAKYARDLTSTFKKLVNHFDLKRGSKTSGELIRSSFSLDKSTKTFVINLKRTLLSINENCSYGKITIKTDFIHIYIEKARFIVKSFPVEINKIIKAEV